MVELFDNDEIGYLKWVQANPQGFVANVDRAGTVPQYPMVHAATHGSMSSSKIGTWTAAVQRQPGCRPPPAPAWGWVGEAVWVQGLWMLRRRGPAQC